MSYKEIIESFDLDTQNLLDVVEDLLVVASFVDDAHLEHELAWRVGIDLIGNSDDAERLLLGYRLVLNAIRQHPDVVLAAVAALYAKVDAIAPRLKVSPP
jgi:hypothetical protein